LVRVATRLELRSLAYVASNDGMVCKLEKACDKRKQENYKGLQSE